MNITSVKIRSNQNTGKMKGIASVVIDNAIAIHDIKIIESNGKRFIAMPSRKTPDGEFNDIVHPINQEARQLLESIILSEFDQAAAQKEDC